MQMTIFSVYFLLIIRVPKPLSRLPVYKQASLVGHWTNHITCTTEIVYMSYHNKPPKSMSYVS